MSEKPKSPTANAQNPDATREQFTAAVDELLDQLQYKFDAVSREMFTKFDDMARRLDELEASLTISGDAATPTTTASTPTTSTK